MKFSIVIPVLNEEKYIGTLLTCLCNQTHKDFEVIIVEGKSEDRTVEVINKYTETLRINLIVSDKRGVAYQRNLGASQAKYPHLIFFDADVAPKRNFLEKLNKKLSKKQYDMLTSWNDPISKKVLDKIIFGAFNILYLETVKYFCPGSVGTFIYVTKEAFDALGGFDLEVFPGEDTDLSKRLHQAGYKYGIMRHPPIPFSVRRLDEEGRRNYIKKQLKIALYYHLKGSVRNPHFVEYTMGNHK